MDQAFIFQPNTQDQKKVYSSLLFDILHRMWDSHIVGVINTRIAKNIHPSAVLRSAQNNASKDRLCFSWQASVQMVERRI